MERHSRNNAKKKLKLDDSFEYYAKVPKPKVEKGEEIAKDCDLALTPTKVEPSRTNNWSSQANNNATEDLQSEITSMVLEEEEKEDLSSNLLLSMVPPIGSEETSTDGLYRYSLTRQWNITKKGLLWVMLNPSSATDKKNDPTMRRCLDFTDDNGYGSMTVVNLFAYRSTDPNFITHNKTGLTHDDVVGNPRNDLSIEQYARLCGGVCLAWGQLSTKAFRQRASIVLHNLLRIQNNGPYVDIFCLEQTMNGQPKHPLYIKKGTKFKRYDYTKAMRIAEEEDAKLLAALEKKRLQVGTKKKRRLLLTEEEEATLISIGVSGTIDVSEGALSQLKEDE